MLTTGLQSYNFEPMSRIALNARLLIPGKLEGTGRFTHQCYKRLIASRPQDQFLLIFDRTPPEEFDFGSNVESVYLFPPARRPWLFDLWFDYAVTWKLKNWRAEVFVSTDGYISRRTDIPQINVIHDINFEHNPEWLPPRYANHFRKRFPEYARLATTLCTVSEFSKADIASKYGLDSKKIVVIPNAPNTIFQPISEDATQGSRDNLTSGNPYIVFVGSLHPRKNIPGIIGAFERYKELGGECELLMIGTSMWRDEKHKTENVHYAGRLNDNALAQAVAGAEAMLYLPFFEGFGVPVVEAMACGVPVVASDCTSIPEVCGGAEAALVDPLDFDGAAQALLKLEIDSVWKKERVEAGLKRASDFNWDKSAKIFDTQLEKILSAK
jgi:glycosyltransferase involved in cell wall biosynthesis